MFCEKCGFYDTRMTEIHVTQRPHVVTQWLCQVCSQKRRFAANQLNSAKLRARKAGLLETLTLLEWMETKEYFSYRCAYCGRENAEDLDHFVPLDLGGCTTKWNCIPACQSCNGKKKNMHPALVKSIPEPAIERVRSFLMNFL